MIPEKATTAEGGNDYAIAQTVSLTETKTGGDGLPTMTSEEEKALVRKIDRK